MGGIPVPEKVNNSYIKILLPNDKITDSKWVRKYYSEELQFHFPYDSLRPQQKEALVIAHDWLFAKDKSVIIVQAPTGFGKSVFAETIGRSVNEDRYYYTSPQLNLIEQVSREFDMPMVRGSQNFVCPTTGDIASEAPCHTDPKFKCETYCEYKRQRDKGALSDRTAITPAFLLRTQQHESSKFDKRKLAIIDECHNLASYIADIMEIVITTRELENVGVAGLTFPEGNKIDEWKKYLAKIIIPLTAKYESIIKNVVERGLSYDEKEVERVKKFLSKLHFVRKLTEGVRPNVIVERDERGRGARRYTAAKFKMVRAAPIAQPFLERMADKYIFMSATILHGKQFLRELGLDDAEALFIDLAESPIQSVKNGPVVVHNTAWLSRKRYATGIDDAVAEIAALLNIYKEDKVVIIPASHNLRADIVAKLSDRGYGKRLMTHGAENKQIPCPGCGMMNPFEGDDFIECPKCSTGYYIFERDNIIGSFYSTTSPKVMVSTYLREGADLKDDLCRCLIIPKIPYPNLGDDLVKTRMKYDQEDYIKKGGGCEEYTKGKGSPICQTWTCPKPCQLWYRMETVKTLVQAAGRIIRSGTDWGSIHILDKSWENFLRNNRRIIPEWFLNCVVDKDEWEKRP